MDEDLPLRLLNELESRVRMLQALAPVTVERLAEDTTYAAAVERHLQIAIQAAIDLAAWVISEHLWREPASYRETFEVLGEQGFLDLPTAHRLADIAGHRNALVHAYLYITPEATARYATEGLVDLTAFAQRCVAEIAGPA